MPVAAQMQEELVAESTELNQSATVAMAATTFGGEGGEVGEVGEGGEDSEGGEGGEKRCHSKTEVASSPSLDLNGTDDATKRRRENRRRAM